MEKESETKNNQETNQEETIDEDGIKEEHVTSSDPEEFIAQTEPMLRKWWRKEVEEMERKEDEKSYWENKEVKEIAQTWEV